MELVERYIAWFDTELQMLESYHARKENMAWAATGFYVTGSVTFGSLLNPTASSVLLKPMLTVGIIFTAVCVTIFVNMHLRARWRAADITRAFRRLRSRLLPLSEMPSDLPLDVPDVPDSPHARIPALPRFVRDEIANCKTPRTFEVFATDVNRLLSGRWSAVDPRVQTEVPSYALIATGTMVTVLSIWL